MGQYIIIHGSYGHPYKNWFPWLYSELARRGKRCTVPSFPTPVGQDYSVWEELLKFYINEGYVDENTTIITHSISCVFIVKFCVKNNFKIAKFISTAGFNDINFDNDDELKDIYKSFYEEPKILERFKDLCPERISFYSDDDPYVPEIRGKEFADIIHAKHVFMQGAGHFNWRTQQHEFKEILEHI